MGFRDLFKEKPEKDKVHSNQSEDNRALDEIHFIIDALWDVDDKKQVVSHCKDAINFLIVEENIDRKTDLLLAGLELSLAQLQKAKEEWTKTEDLFTTNTKSSFTRRTLRNSPRDLRRLSSLSKRNAL